jgi:hypothetical protein
MGLSRAFGRWFVRVHGSNQIERPPSKQEKLIVYVAEAMAIDRPILSLDPDVIAICFPMAGRYRDGAQLNWVNHRASQSE